MRSRNLADWSDHGLLTLGQAKWEWARHGRLTAGCVLDLRDNPTVGKALMFFHASALPEARGGISQNCSLGIAWSDDLITWQWPGSEAED